MITTIRSKMIGSHITKEMRDQLQDIAANQKVSLSRLVYEILKEWLEKNESPSHK